MSSIRRRLLIGLLAVALASGVVAAAGVYLQARHEANEMFDYQLKQMALSLRDQTFQELVQTEPSVLEEHFDFIIQVWRNDGARLYFSHPRPGLPNRARLGYATVDAADGRWRVFSIEQRGLVFQVAQPMSVRNELAAAAALRTLLPFVLLLPALGLLIWFTVGRGLRPLNAMARAVRARTPTALAPLPEAGMPEEIQPLAAALNDLLRRLDRTLSAQRHFVGDAAHELRTPLTALRLQAQLAERAVTPEARAATFATLKEGLTRSAHLVEQLLTLAREEPDASERPVAPVDLAALAREVIAEQMVLADAKRIDLGMKAAEPATVEADREGLRVMLRNLVDNAVRYTPEGGTVDVAVSADTGATVVEVSDSGPGIPAAERRRVFDRFYRGGGHDLPGSGLGLAIVKSVADRHGAEIALSDGPGGRGLAVRVVFSKGSRPVPAEARLKPGLSEAA